jgi:hypothetical protein
MQKEFVHVHRAVVFLSVMLIVFKILLYNIRSLVFIFSSCKLFQVAKRSFGLNVPKLIGIMLYYLIVVNTNS